MQQIKTLNINLTIFFVTRALLVLVAVGLNPVASSATVSVSGRSCEEMLIHSPALLSQIRAEMPTVTDQHVRFMGFLRLDTRRDMFVRIDQPNFASRGREQPVKGWFFLVHGLLDSHRGYDEVTKILLADGFGVIRMDLTGFARSLHFRALNIESQGGVLKAPTAIHYKDHVADLKSLIVLLNQEFGIVRPRLVGHSMGGGLVAALLNEPGIKELVDARAILLTPYVYRLEYYYAEKLSGLTLPYLPHTFSLYERVIPKAFLMGTEYWLDKLISEPQMRVQFTEFFERLLVHRDIQFKVEHLQRIKERHIQFAIASVKGLRELDTIRELRTLTSDVRLDFVSATRDTIIDPGLAQKLASSVQDRGGRHWVLNSTHMVLNDTPDEVAPILEMP